MESHPDARNQQKLRIDKWLWAARFFKTRSLAADAVECGKVQVNNARIKPAKMIAAGDMLVVRLGPYQHVIEVLALSSKRGSAPDAQNLYRETEESRLRRVELAIALKAQPGHTVHKGRPTKRDRRAIEKFRNGGQ